MGQDIVSRLTVAPPTPAATFGTLYPLGASDATLQWYFKRADGNVRTLANLEDVQTFSGALTLSAALTYGGVTLSNTVTGTGKMVLDNSPVLVAPALGTPVSGVMTNVTGTAAGLTAGNVITNANLTGHVTSTGNATVLGSFTLAQLNTAISDADVATGGGTATGTNTGDQTITLTGGVTGSGTGSFAATVVTNANLTGPITSVGNATAVAAQTGTGSTFAMQTSPAFLTQISTPSIVTASGALEITPAAGSNLNVNLSTTGDFAVNTNQFYVDTSTGGVGIGTIPAANAKLYIKVGTNQNLYITSLGGVLYWNAVNDALSLDVPLRIDASEIRLAGVNTNMHLGGTTWGASAAHVFTLTNGTAPGALANTASIVALAGKLWAYDANGVGTQLTP